MIARDPEFARHYTGLNIDDYQVLVKEMGEGLVDELDGDIEPAAAPDAGGDAPPPGTHLH